MSYSKEVLGFDVLESVEYLASGIAVSLEYKDNKIYIKPANKDNNVIGITLEEYVRGQANSKISVSVVAFSRALAGGTFNASDLVGINNNGEFVKADDNIKPFAIAITDGYLGKYFQLLNINIKGSGSSGGVSSVNGDTGDVVIDASKIGSVISHGTQAQFNEGVQKSFDYVSEELPKKQSKLVANESIEIVDNKINDKVIEGLKVVLTNPTDGRVSMTGSAKVVGRLIYLYARLDGAPQTFNQISLQINDVPDYVFLVENNSVILGKENGGNIFNCSASRDTDKTKVNFNILSRSGLMVNGGVSIAHVI